ncbi:MAG: hypothetical protein A2X18_11305 [Bacteroidetes bacterium GWF2_40_14]|nr:MAG: hypothetical protein A2X18_11305 [Bacteroidetes bacterium GWF2_40_14]
MCECALSFSQPKNFLEVFHIELLFSWLLNIIRKIFKEIISYNPAYLQIAKNSFGVSLKFPTWLSIT